MNLSGAQNRIQIANSAPYSLFTVNGVGNSTYSPWTPAVGSYTLLATPFTESNASGLAGSPLAINFTVILSPPTITAVSQEPNGHFIITGQADPLSLISIQVAPDIISTFGAPTSVGADSNGAFQYEDPEARKATKQFYRVSY